MERELFSNMKNIFPSGNKADLVFLLSDGKFLMVKVEMKVGNGDIVGLYKHMYAACNGLNFEEVEGALVVKEIDKNIKQLCEKYSIGYKEVLSEV